MQHAKGKRDKRRLGRRGEECTHSEKERRRVEHRQPRSSGREEVRDQVQLEHLPAHDTQYLLIPMEPRTAVA